MIVCLDDGFHMSKDLEYAENILMSPSQVAENEEEDSTTHSTQEQNKVEEKVPSGEMLEQKLNSLNVEVEYKDYPVANTITWKRKINYIYDENLNIYRGTKKDYVVHEEYVLLRISALEFASKANSLEEVEAFYNEFKKKFQYRLKNTPLEDKLLRLSSNPWNGLKKKRWIFLIEGLNDYYRKRSTLENRKMREIMKSQLTPNRPKRHRKETINEEEMPIDPRSFCGVDMGKYFKLKGSLSNYPSPQVLEEAFLWLQMTGECLVIFSSGWDKTVEWICTFTKEISITPFKEKIEQSNNYCTYNKIKTEADYSKIWYRMLEEVYRISPTIIERIIKEYPTVFSLYEKYQQVDEKTGEALLEDLEVVSSTGNVRKIGKSISKRIYTWFTEEDGNKKAI
ncbi:hypothetical protein BCR36DRAFT_287409 [Piromyces finnis]|uniref:ERCC4 domain-containing protein n=1 Tax=Piromyces finnis TaxID=1754191 RepID=A0A1Y1VD29_9FUNG|nr:hypothetical protein BCR36DRAFT_287409 [Piromyces finnis]|eukprot:ORX51757.1 hypothetical protein BCR36DRAFT_287409 [Piromyces finnis]